MLWSWPASCRALRASSRSDKARNFRLPACLRRRLENATPPQENEDRGKAALTALFQEVKNAQTPVIVERVVADVDEIVRLVRFPGWQHTSAGEREVKKALRKSLLKYQLHQDTDLFERAYGYVRQYY